MQILILLAVSVIAIVVFTIIWGGIVRDLQALPVHMMQKKEKDVVRDVDVDVIDAS